MQGPYRDLGAGFARLLGAEGLRRSPGRLRSVEDALFEMVRNSRDAGARNIYVASSLSARRYRQLVVIDDGRGLPETHKDLVFEPGVTTRHLAPVPEEDPAQDTAPHGAGLSLYHIKNAALSAEVLSASSPTVIRATFDTRSLPEKRLQSNTGKTSKSNLPATLAKFATAPDPAPKNPPHIYHASPARILARLLENRIIQNRLDTAEREPGGGGVGGAGSRDSAGKGARRVREAAAVLGLDVSLRTVQRILAREVPAAAELTARGEVVGGRGTSGGSRGSAGREGPEGPILSVGSEDLAGIRAALRRAARSSYLEVADLEVETGPGVWILKARVYEQEDEYEE